MTYIEPVTRKEGRSFGRPTHWYVDGRGDKIPGVTGLLDQGKPKPALVGWGIKSVAEYALNNWDDLAAMPVADRLTTLKRSPYAERDAAANRGTEVHALGERLIHGEDVEVPEPLAGHVEAYVRFLDEWQPQPVIIERTVYHLTYGYAGTLDMVVTLPDGRRALLDIKTSKAVYGDTAFQLAAYRYASHYLDDDGAAQPMPEVDWCGVVHVRADGYDVYELRADEDVLRQFRYIAAVARAAEASKGYVSDPLPVPQPTLDLGVTA